MVSSTAWDSSESRSARTTRASPTHQERRPLAGLQGHRLAAKTDGCARPSATAREVNAKRKSRRRSSLASDPRECHIREQILVGPAGTCSRLLYIRLLRSGSV